MVLQLSKLDAPSAPTCVSTAQKYDDPNAHGHCHPHFLLANSEAADPSAYSQGRSPSPTEASRVSADRVRCRLVPPSGQRPPRPNSRFTCIKMKDEALLVETLHRYGCGSSWSAHGKLINAASSCRNATCGDKGDCSRWVALTELPDSVVSCEANRNGGTFGCLTTLLIS